MSSHAPDKKSKEEAVAPAAALTPSAGLRIEKDGQTFVGSATDVKASESLTVALPMATSTHPAIEDTPEALNAAITAHEQWLKDPAQGRCLDLSSSKLSRATLEAGNWVNRNLNQASFGTAEIGGLDFTDSDLTEVNLSNVKQLQPQQFAGAILNRANLPKEFEFPQIATSEEMSKNCGKYFLTILSACAFILLTVLSTKDAALISDTTTSTLPILQTSVSIVQFYIWAPLVLLVVYTFYLLNMQDLWRVMATLPAVFKDGRNISQTTYPWIVNRAAAYYSGRIPKTDSNFITHIVTMALVYWSVPVTVAIMWIHAIRRHDIPLTNWHAFSFATSIYLSLLGTRSAIAALKRSSIYQSLCSPFAEILTTPITIHRFEGLVWHVLAAVLCSSIALLLVRTSYTIINESKPVLSAFLRRANINTSIDIDSANVSARPEKWVGTKQEDYESIAGANLRGLDLRRLNGENAFLVHADLRGCNLSSADLQYADLRSVLVRQADGQTHKIPAATLAGANLGNARLDYADLLGVDLSDTKLGYAALTNARLPFTNLTNADLLEADLNGADLIGATLTNANLKEADLRGADLSKAQGLNIKQLEAAFGDETTMIDLKLRPNNTHWPKQKLTDARLKKLRGL